MEEKTVVQNTAKRIRQLRQLKGWSQENLAHASGLSVAYIGQLEREQKIPTIETIDKICTALDVSLPYFFSFGNNSFPTGDEYVLPIDTVITSLKSMPEALAKRIAFLIKEIENLNTKK